MNAPKTEAPQADTTETPTKTFAVVAAGNTLPSAAMAKMQKAKHVDKFKANELLLPWLQLVQTTSGYMKRGKPTYNAEAREGDITDSLSRKLRSTQAVILVKFETHYTTWAPGGGKLVKQWFLDPTGYNAARYPEGKNYGDKIDSDGNVVRQVPMYYILAIDPVSGTADPMSMAWGSTQAKKTRAVNSQARYDLIGDDGLPFTPPIYSRIFDVTSVLEGDGDNSWAGWNAEVAGLVLGNEKFGAMWYAKAEAFRDQIDMGNVRPAAPEGAFEDSSEHDEPQQVGDVPATPSEKNTDDIPF